MKELFNDWWGERAPREKTLLGSGALILALVILYSILWSPAQTGRTQLLHSLPGMQNQLAQMEAQAVEARSLSGVAASVVPAGNSLRDALTAALADHGLPNGQLTVLGNGVQVQLKNASFAAWVGWLDDARKRFKVQVSEAHVIAQKPDGQVDINATLQPANAQ